MVKGPAVVKNNILLKLFLRTQNFSRALIQQMALRIEHGAAELIIKGLRLIMEAVCFSQPAAMK